MSDAPSPHEDAPRTTSRPTRPAGRGAEGTPGSGPAPQPQRVGPPVGPREVAFVVVLVLAAVFILENTKSTGIRLIGPVVDTPIWAALLITFLLGIILGYLVALRRSRARVRKG